MARSKSTDESLTPSESGPPATAADGPVLSMGRATPERRQAALQRGKLARKIQTMADGDYIEGRLIGPGGELDVETPDGDRGMVATWDFDMGAGITIGILGSHQLDSELPTYLGHQLYVERVQSKNVGKRRVTEFAIVDLDPSMPRTVPPRRLGNGQVRVDVPTATPPQAS